MIRTQVIIDGVTLTRKQIEAAHKELNRAEYNPGDIIRHTNYSRGERFLVVATEWLRKPREGHTWVVNMVSGNLFEALTDYLCEIS